MSVMAKATLIQGLPIMMTRVRKADFKNARLLVSFIPWDVQELFLLLLSTLSVRIAWEGSDLVHRRACMPRADAELGLPASRSAKE